MWSVVCFGNEEIKGKTLPQIVFRDPSWFFWAIEEGVFSDKGKLTEEAKEINYKARNIKVPQQQGKGKLSAIYFLHPYSHDFDHIIFSREYIEKDMPVIEKDRLDLSIPFQLNCYDKKGGEILVENLKGLYFKDKIITKSSYEEFFENNDNFIL